MKTFSGDQLHKLQNNISVKTFLYVYLTSGKIAQYD